MVEVVFIRYFPLIYIVHYTWMRLWHHLPQMWVNRNVLVEQNNWCWFYEEGVSNNFSIYNFRLCYKLKRILHVSLKREPSKPTLLLRDKIYKRTYETMYNKEMIKWVERRKLCTNLKIITFTCLCNAFTMYHELNSGKESEKLA